MRNVTITKRVYSNYHYFIVKDKKSKNILFSGKLQDVKKVAKLNNWKIEK